jgi:hypothetical protein
LFGKSSQHKISSWIYAWNILSIEKIVMKRFLFFSFLFLLSIELFSQQFGVGAFASEMHHSFYVLVYDSSPHRGFKAGFQKGGGLNTFIMKQGRVNEDNLRYNYISLTFYEKETDSILATGRDDSIYSYSQDPVVFHGTQTTNYQFLTFGHTNFFKSKFNDFFYYLIGFHLGGARNKSTYYLPGYSPSRYYMDPGVHGRLPASQLGFFVGVHAGFAYEFERFFIHLQINYDWSFFALPVYSLGARTSADLGVSIPIFSKK